MTNLASQVVIENVVQSKMRGKVTYQSHLLASTVLNLVYVKPFNDRSGKGYQRPVNQKRADDFARYLSQGENALFTPILLNAAGKWEFTPYDKYHPSVGRLICKDRASLMDGQHRLQGINKYIKETNSEINVLFLAFHYLDDDEEIQLFDTINTKAKGIGTSLSKFLKRDSDELSWIATELLMQNDSPFYLIGTITGKRTKERYVTLQNLYKAMQLLTKDTKISILNKEEKLSLADCYFSSLRETFSAAWLDYNGHRITHIVCIDALSIAGAKVLSNFISETKQIDYNGINKCVKKLRKIDWSVNGPMKYLKGMSASKTLAADLETQMLS